MRIYLIKVLKEFLLLGSLPENSSAILMVQAIRETFSLMKAEFLTIALLLIALESCRRSLNAARGRKQVYRLQQQEDKVFPEPNFCSTLEIFS